MINNIQYKKLDFKMQLFNLCLILNCPDAQTYGKGKWNIPL